MSQSNIIFQDNSELYGRTLRINLAKAMRMRENSSKPVWADDDWLSTFAGKQALEHQRQDQGLPKETSESQSTETEVASTKAKRPAETAAAEGMVRHNKTNNSGDLNNGLVWHLNGQK